MASDRPEIVIELNKFPILAAEIAGRADTVCERTAQAVEANAKLLIQNPPKTGRIYELGERNVTFLTGGGAKGKVRVVSFTVNKGKASRQHQASAPGEAPATDTGNLVNTGYSERKGTADWEVGFSAEYAAPLEYGTPTILPRPYLRPSVEKHRQGFMDAMSEATAGREGDLPDAAGGGGGGGAM